MKAARFFIVLVLVTLFSISHFELEASSFENGAGQTSGAVQASRLAGVVMDINDARIAGAAIRIENTQFNRLAKSDDEGRFEISVPPGTYEITVEQPGFRKFQLSRFRVGEGTCELVNIHMGVQPPKSPLKSTPVSEGDLTRLLKVTRARKSKGELTWLALQVDREPAEPNADRYAYTAQWLNV